MTKTAIFVFFFVKNSGYIEIEEKFKMKLKKLEVSAWFLRNPAQNECCQLEKYCGKINVFILVCCFSLVITLHINSALLSLSGLKLTQQYQPSSTSANL